MLTQRTVSGTILAVMLCGAQTASAVQAKLLTRTMAKLPTCATLKKAVTWKRAGIGALALGFLAYKKFVKTDAQILRKFLIKFEDDAIEMAKSKRKRAVHTEKTSRKAVHWFGRSKHAGLMNTASVLFDMGNTSYNGQIVHTIKPGYFIDTHSFDARVEIEKNDRGAAADMTESEDGPLLYGSLLSGAETKKSVAAAASAASFTGLSFSLGDDLDDDSVETKASAAVAASSGLL